MPNMGRILVMDDEENVQTLFCKVLSRLGFSVDTANTGEEALDIFKKRFSENETYEAVITDLTVPGFMGGVKLAEELHKLDPTLKVIISSGYSEDEVISHYQDYGFSGAVSKPFSLDELKSALGISS